MMHVMICACNRESPNRGRRLSTLVEEECSEPEADGTLSKNRRSLRSHLSIQGPRELQSMEPSLKPAPPEYKAPPPYRDSLSRSRENSPQISSKWVFTGI